MNFLKILFVYTSVTHTLTGSESGWYLSEAAHPYYILAPLYEIDFAAPLGPNPPVDPASVELFKDEESQKFLADETVKQKLASAKKLSDVDAADYAAIFYVGGHGPVIDLATDPVNVKLANTFWRSNKIVSAVCHGPAALVGVTDASDPVTGGAQGASIFKNRAATCLTYTEETQLQKTDAIPFQPEHRLRELGAKFESAGPFEARVVVDGRLITGQNPASGKGVGEALLRALKE